MTCVGPASARRHGADADDGAHGVVLRAHGSAGRGD